MTSRPAKVYTTREIDALGATLVRWLWFSIGGSVLGLTVAGIELLLLNRVPSDRSLGPFGDVPGPEIVTLLTGLGRLPILALIVVTGFLFLKWIYRASRNAHAMAGPLRTSPPWAVGWFFVPVAFLWVPFTAFSETWRASHDPAGWRSISAVVVGVLAGREPAGTDIVSDGGRCRYRRDPGRRDLGRDAVLWRQHRGHTGRHHHCAEADGGPDAAAA